MAQAHTEVVVFDGEEFRISPQEVRGYLLMPPWLGLGLAGGLGCGLVRLWPGGGFPASGPSWLSARSLALLGSLALAATVFRDTFKKLEAKLIPFLMAKVDYHFLSIRQELLKGIKGDVLDVGCGDGMYLPYYVDACRRSPGKGVHRALMLEPNLHLHSALRANVEVAKKQMPSLEVETTSSFLEDLPQSEQFDSIVFGNVLCEVPCQKDFFQAVDAHLKPGGRVYFSEHVLSEFSLLRLLQHAVSPAWVCHCNRDSIKLLSAQPWVQELRTWSFAGTFPVCRWELGIAVKQRAPTP